MRGENLAKFWSPSQRARTTCGPLCARPCCAERLLLLQEPRKPHKLQSSRARGFLLNSRIHVRFHLLVSMCEETMVRVFSFLLLLLLKKKTHTHTRDVQAAVFSSLLARLLFFFPCEEPAIGVLKRIKNASKKKPRSYRAGSQTCIKTFNWTPSPFPSTLLPGNAP